MLRSMITTTLTTKQTTTKATTIKRPHLRVEIRVIGSGNVEYRVGVEHDGLGVADDRDGI